MLSWKLSRELQECFQTCRVKALQIGIWPPGLTPCSQTPSLTSCIPVNVKSPGAIIAYFRATSYFSDDAAILAPLSDRRPFCFISVKSNTSCWCTNNSAESLHNKHFIWFWFVFSSPTWIKKERLKSEDENQKPAKPVSSQYLSKLHRLSYHRNRGPQHKLFWLLLVFCYFRTLSPNVCLTL